MGVHTWSELKSKRCMVWEEKGNVVCRVSRKFPVWLCVMVCMVTEPIPT